MALAEVLWARRRTVRLAKELNRLGLRDGLAILDGKVAGQHCVTNILATLLNSSPCCILLPPSNGANVFTVHEFQIF